MTNCPNCGAPIRGAVCEYCGTIIPRYKEKLEAYKTELAKLSAELENAKAADYLLNAMGKWIQTPVAPSCIGGRR